MIRKVITHATFLYIKNFIYYQPDNPEIYFEDYFRFDKIYLILDTTRYYTFEQILLVYQKKIDEIESIKEHLKFLFNLLAVEKEINKTQIIKKYSKVKKEFKNVKAGITTSN